MFLQGNRDPIFVSLHAPVQQSCEWSMSNKSHCVDRYKTHSDKYTSVERWHQQWFKVPTMELHSARLKPQICHLLVAHLCTAQSSCYLSLPARSQNSWRWAKGGVTHSGIPNSAQALLIAPILVFTQSNYSGPLGLSFSKRRKRISKCARSTDQWENRKGRHSQWEAQSFSEEERRNNFRRYADQRELMSMSCPRWTHQCCYGQRSQPKATAGPLVSDFTKLALVPVSTSENPQNFSRLRNQFLPRLGNSKATKWIASSSCK